MERLAGRTAVVTGGGSGIGRGIALALSSEGMRVAVLDVNGEAAATVASELAAQGGESLALATDVTSSEQLAAAAKEVSARFGDASLLCANAGVMLPLGPLTEKSESDWEYVFSVNVFGVVKTVNAFLPQLRASDEAHIVTTASMGGIFAVPRIPIGVYVASKYACVGYTESLRGELAAEGIGVSVLCPGFVPSNLYSSSAVNRPERFGGPEPAAVDSDASGAVPPGSMRAEDVGPVVVRGVRENRLHLFTHPDDAPGAEKRFARIRAGFEAATRGGV